MKITIKDIAKKSGFSISTVSRVLTNKSNVDVNTRKRIEEVIKSFNYRPNTLARSLVTGQSNIVAIIIGDMWNPFYSVLANSAQELFATEGYLCVICYTNYEIEKEERFLQTADDYGFAGVIMVTAPQTVRLLEQLKQVICPIVLINRNFQAFHTDVVSVDNFQGGYIATQHLIELGHKKIAHLTGPEHSNASEDRLRGYISAMGDHNLEVGDGYVYRGDWRPGKGHSFGLYLLEQKPEITAAFCGNDMMAIGLVQAFAEAGKEIPRDLSIIGYDDSPVAVSGKVKLTTVTGHHNKLGITAAELILRRIANPQEPSQRVVYAPSLIVRESTAIFNRP